jgi:endonuclease YncB( thermonuclease family)
VKISLQQGAYDGHIVRAADGDTLIVLIKIGWGVYVEKHCRILGIDSWELAGPHEAKARQVQQRINSMWQMKPCRVFLSNRGLDKYGRFRARVAVDGRDVAKILVDLGLAWYRKGKIAEETMPGTPLEASPRAELEAQPCG